MVHVQSQSAHKHQQWQHEIGLAQPAHLPDLLHAISRLGRAQCPHGITANLALVLVLDLLRLAPI